MIRAAEIYFEGGGSLNLGGYFKSGDNTSLKETVVENASSGTQYSLEGLEYPCYSVSLEFNSDTTVDHIVVTYNC